MLYKNGRNENGKPQRSDKRGDYSCVCLKSSFCLGSQTAALPFVFFVSIRCYQHFYTKYLFEEPTLELAARKIKVAGHEFMSQNKDNELFRLAQTAAFLQTKVEFLSSSLEEDKKNLYIGENDS